MNCWSHDEAFLIERAGFELKGVVSLLASAVLRGAVVSDFFAEDGVVFNRFVRVFGIVPLVLLSGCTDVARVSVPDLLRSVVNQSAPRPTIINRIATSISG